MAQQVRDGYNLVTYPEDWELDDRAVDIVTPIGKAQAVKPDKIHLITTEHLLSAGCTFTPLHAISPAEIETLALYLEHNPYRAKDWGGHWPEMEAAYDTLVALLARLKGDTTQ